MKTTTKILAAFFCFTQFTFAQTIVVVSKDYNHPDKYEAVLINAQGKVLRTINKESNEDVSTYSEGIWIVRKTKETTNDFFFSSNFLDENGEKILKNDIDGFASGFYDGWCLINHKNDDGSQTHYYVDKLGQEVFKPIANELGDFYNGVAWKRGLEGTADENYYGLINKKGEQILKPTYFEIRNFENGIAQVMTAMSATDGSASQQYAYIDTTGKIVNNPAGIKKYDSNGALSEAIRVVGKRNDNSNKMEFTAINNLGEALFAKKFYSSSIEEYPNFNEMKFQNGLCPTSDGYINTKGEVVIQFPNAIIADATAFNNGLASFKMIPKNGDGFSFHYVVVDAKGNSIWKSVENKLSEKLELKN
jgi:WG containing repeat